MTAVSTGAMSPTFVAVPMTAISPGAMSPHKWMVGMTAISPGAMTPHKCGLHQISPFMINASQVMMRIFITKICCPSVKVHCPLLILQQTSYSMVVRITQYTNRTGIICLDPLHQFFNHFFICYTASVVGITKRTLHIVSKLTEGVHAPSTNALPTTFIIYFHIIT